MFGKFLLVILLIGFVSLSDAQKVFRQPIIVQGYLGMAVPLGQGQGIESGLTYNPYWRLPLFIGLDYTKIYSTKKYTWPEVGDYKYRTRVEFISPVLGGTFFRRKRVSISLGLKLDFVTSKGKLLTDNPDLTTYLLNRYEEKEENLSGFLHIHGRLIDQVSAFCRLSLIRSQITNIQGTLGFGLTYNFLSKKAPSTKKP